MKIIIFPFAGGNKNSFNYLKKPLLKKGILIETIEYTNKEFDYLSQRLESVEEILDLIFPQFIEAVKDEDYIIYGHSMGALIGYLVCLKVEKLKLRKPLKLIVSGRAAPSFNKEDIIHDLPKDLFLKKIRELGGVPEEVLKEKDLMDLFEPILRADIKAIEVFKYQGKANLSIPVEVVYGSEEKIEMKDVIEWKKESNKEVIITELKGNHFFIHQNVDFFVNLFIETSKLI